MTEQSADVLLYQGKRYPLLAHPLESIWSEDRPRPFFISPHTANWRGYVATWEIRDRCLWLREISGSAYGDSDGNIITGKSDLMQNPLRLTGTGPPIEITVLKLFPGLEGPVLAEWYSGTIRIPMGPLVAPIGYNSVFENEFHITFQNGRAVGEKHVASGELFRRETERREAQTRAQRNVPLVAKLYEDGWLKCPHCGASFSAKKGSWRGDRHAICGGRIILKES